jgi:zinc-finger of transposase IS204/IS1001/IS1096/IS1165
VIDAVDLLLGSRRVKVAPVDLADGCPACGVVSGRVHAWVVQRVRDVPYAGQVEVLVRKPRGFDAVTLTSKLARTRAPSWWDDETILALMRIREMECRNRYAEAF